MPKETFYYATSKDYNVKEIPTEYSDKD